MVDVYLVKKKYTPPVNDDVLAAQYEFDVSADALIGLTDIYVKDSEVTLLYLPDIRKHRQF